jgi:putative FmdB family regulatory protein
MPIYEYKCMDCGARFEAMRGMRDADSPAQCKKCLGSNSKRTMSTFYAKSGERAVAGSQAHTCGGCGGGNCGQCGH